MSDASPSPAASAAISPRRVLPNHVVLWRGHRHRMVLFGPFAGLGVALGLALVAARFAAAGIDPDAVLPLLACVLVPGIVVGSRAWALVVELRVRPLREAIVRTGFAFQGGLLGVAIGLLVGARWLDLSPLLVTDVFAASLPAAHAIGRLGCLSYGCCYGRPTNVPWALRYSCTEAKAVWEGGLAGVAIHPTPLYQALGSVLFAGVLAVLAWYPVPLGTLTGVYLFVAAAGRWTLEHFRQAPVRPTPFQRFALIQAAAGAAVLVLASFQPAAPWAGHLAVPSASLLAQGAWRWVLLGALCVALPLGIQGRRPGVF